MAYEQARAMSVSGPSRGVMARPSLKPTSGTGSAIGSGMARERGRRRRSDVSLNSMMKLLCLNSLEFGLQCFVRFILENQALL